MCAVQMNNAYTNPPLDLRKIVRFSKNLSLLYIMSTAVMSVSQVTAKHVILTGPPGIGKTTLVQKICQVLKEKEVSHAGFVTQEIRENGKRTGFEIITTDGQRGTLSSINSTSKRKVGQYGVEVEQFEALALPLFSRLSQESSSEVLVIDEVGKMELFSDRFKQCVNQAFKSPSVKIVVTIPIKKGKELPFVEEIRNRPDGKLFMIDRVNRNTILNDILSVLQVS